jgi:hypothetical protein
MAQQKKTKVTKGGIVLLPTTEIDTDTTENEIAIEEEAKLIPEEAQEEFVFDEVFWDTLALPGREAPEEMLDSDKLMFRLVALQSFFDLFQQVVLPTTINILETISSDRLAPERKNANDFFTTYSRCRNVSIRLMNLLPTIVQQFNVAIKSSGEMLNYFGGLPYVERSKEDATVTENYRKFMHHSLELIRREIMLQQLQNPQEQPVMPEPEE